MVAFLALALLWIHAPAQTSGGKTIQFLWPNRRAPVPVPWPSYFTASETTYTATDTTNNSWMVAYPASNPNGTAIITMPGGGYMNLAGWVREGTQIAAKMNGYGITTFILHYRYGSNGNAPFEHPCEMWDAQRSVRWVRAHAAQYGINPNRIGVMGFSSGGHMATTVAIRNDAGNPDSTSIDWYPGIRDTIDNYSCKPNFQVLGYPMTSMLPSIAYSAGRTALLGASHPASLDTLMSNELHVVSTTPPAFLVWGKSDGTVNPQNSIHYIDSLLAHGVAVDTFPVVTTVHGFGLADSAAGTTGSTYNIPAAKPWPDSMMAWLGRQGFVGTTAIAPAHARGAVPPYSKINQDALDLLGRRYSNPNQARGSEEMLKPLPIKE